MNLASALLVIYLSAITSQPAKVLTEKTKVGRVPRTTRTRSLVRYRFPSRLAPYFKRSYNLPERAEDLALEELLKDESEDSQEKLNTIAQQNSEEDKDNENDTTEEEENEGDEEKEKHRLSSKRSFFAFNDLPLTRTLRWIPQRPVREAFVKSSRQRFGYLQPKDDVLRGYKRRRGIYPYVEEGSKTSSGRRFFNLQEKAKKSIAEPNEPVDWSDYFGIDKREDIDDNANERLKEITFWKKRMNYVHGE